MLNKNMNLDLKNERGEKLKIVTFLISIKKNHLNESTSIEIKIKNILLSRSINFAFALTYLYKALCYFILLITLSLA